MKRSNFYITGDFIRIINNIYNELFIRKHKLLGSVGVITNVSANKTNGRTEFCVKIFDCEYTLLPEEVEQITEDEYLAAKVLQS